MNLLTDIVAAALASIPLLLTLGLVTLMLALAHFLLIRRNRDLGNERLFSRQLIMLALTLIGLVAVILALPVSEGARNQIIALLGLLIRCLCLLVFQYLCQPGGWCADAHDPAFCAGRLYLRGRALWAGGGAGAV
ncbi:hypothetical protein ULG90_23530 [Halopseudomonas pachastrellae]|nr:hypothetical protein ULG90_23530 [Halopseudomonas pachastrellae]